MPTQTMPDSNPTTARELAVEIPQDMLPMLAGTKGLTPQLIQQFCGLASEGIPMHVICDYLGYASGTVYSWLKIGEKWFENEGFPEQHTIHAAFLQQLRRHHAQYLVGVVRELNTAEHKEWPKLMTILERRDRGTWGRTAMDGFEEEGMDPDEKFL